jgi:hypothetical protein
VILEGWRLWGGREPYAGSTEELTPTRLDWVSAIPLAMSAIALLVSPKFAAPLARRGWGAHLLDLNSIRRIERDDFGKTT